jgi:probable nitrogen fixation protein
MIATPTQPVEISTDIYDAPFLKELARQIRAQDHYGVYRDWSDELVLKPFIVTREKKRQIPVDGEVDPVTKARILAFYRAIAARIEQTTSTLSQVVVDLSHEGFGWALIFSGRLLVVARTLRDAHRFGFDSPQKLEAEGEKITQAGIALVNNYPEVVKL